eukprot:15461868-Alexandrium_andersonii.AAC.1
MQVRPWRRPPLAAHVSALSTLKATGSPAVDRSIAVTGSSIDALGAPPSPAGSCPSKAAAEKR